MRLQLPEDAGQIRTVAQQDFPGVRWLQIANAVWIKVVKTHMRQRLVKRPKLGEPRRVDKIEPIAGRRWVYLEARSHNGALANRIEDLSGQRNQIAYAAFFRFDFVSALRSSPDPKRVPSLRPIRQPELQPDAKVSRMSPRPSSNLLNSSAISQSVVE